MATKEEILNSLTEQLNNDKLSQEKFEELIQRIEAIKSLDI